MAGQGSEYASVASYTLTSIPLPPNGKGGSLSHNPGCNLLPQPLSTNFWGGEGAWPVRARLGRVACVLAYCLYPYFLAQPSGQLYFRHYYPF